MGVQDGGEKGRGEKRREGVQQIQLIEMLFFLYVHLPCERNDGLDCLKFPSCSLVQTQGLNEYRCMSFRPWASSLQTI